MRILNVMQCTGLGGMEHSSLLLMKTMRAAGHDVRVLSLNPIGGLGPLLVEAGIPAEGQRYRGPAGMAGLPELRRRIRAAPADALLMTGHNLMAMLALGDVARGRRVLAVHFHHEGVKPAWQWRLIYRMALRRFGAVTFCSDFIRLEAERLFPPLAPMACTVRNAYEAPPPPTDAERLAARAELHIPPAAAVVGNAGWLIARKRWDVFLRTARRVADAIPGAQFLIVGDGPERSALERLAGELGLRGCVQFLGWRRDVRTAYRCMDVMLFNSDWDAMGRTPLEASMAGVPVVASVRQGGLGEVICDPSLGCLLSDHDEARLAEAVGIFCRDRALGRRTAAALRGRLMEVGSPERVAAEYLGLLGGGARA